jgi:hypothetical protein
MKIFIAQYYTENLTHGKYAEEINKKYAEENGYGYYCEKSNEKIINYLDGRAPTWYKSKLILDVFETYSPDYVLFLDTDAVISDTNIKIEEFIIEGKNFIASQDVGSHSLMNAGVFLVKNNEWSIRFMNEWFKCSRNLRPTECTYRPEVSEHDKEDKTYFSNRLWMDQTALTHLYYDREEFKDKIEIISNRSFNWSQYNDNNFIFHAYSYGNIKNRTLDKVYNEVFNIKVEYDYSTLMGLAEKYYTDKHFGHDFFNQVYQKEFEKIKNTALKVVELGVHEGQSINIWREFFKNAKIIGIDCNINAANIDNNERVDLVSITTGYNDDVELENFSSLHNDIDLFIDDGSHLMKDQQVTLGKLFKSIKSGGIYVLEDLHTSVSVKEDKNSIFKSDKNTITLDMLEHFNTTGKIKSDYLTYDECKYLEENIETCEIYKLKPNWSYTSIIRKK